MPPAKTSDLPPRGIKGDYEGVWEQSLEGQRHFKIGGYEGALYPKISKFRGKGI